MRIAILSDLHGNLVSLEAALADLDALGVDRTICLGDVAVTGPMPRQTTQRLMELGCPVVMGNTDAWALDPHSPPAFKSDDQRKLHEIELWGAAQLGEEERQFLRTFQPQIELDLGGERLLCYHGSPRSFNEAILATTPEENLAEMLDGAVARILVGGHTHLQMARRFQDKFVVNAGSVGLPFETHASGAVRNPLWAEYALVCWEHGRLQIELCRAPVEVEALKRSALESGMPHARWWLQDWL